MTDDPFRRFHCWTTAVVQETVFGDIASLGLDSDPVFLAAHVSLPVHHLHGVQLEDAQGELALLRALTSSFGVAGQNTLIAVTGPSGSGKSHLVRWVHAQLPEAPDRYYVVYVPKALETLRGLLEHILSRMPGTEADAVRAELEKAVGQKSPEELADELVDRLKSVLTFGMSDTRPGQDNEMRNFVLGTPDPGSKRREDGLGDLLLVKTVRDHLLRGGRRSRPHRLVAQRPPHRRRRNAVVQCG